MNMFILSSIFSSEGKDINELTFFKIKSNFIFCLFCLLKSSIKKVKDN
jgi:hypothetical protein